MICFIAASIETACAAGVWAGRGVALLRELGLPGPTGCVESLAAAVGCDLVVGGFSQRQVYDTPWPTAFNATAFNATAPRSWVPSAAYDADQWGIMRTSPPLGPWAFLAPFSPWLWACVLALACVVVPLVSSVVEYDQGESFAGNFGTYLVSSVHAFAGVDPMYHTGDAYTKESGVMSAVVAITSKVLLSVYGCNLVAFVIAEYLDASVYTSRRVGTVATPWPWLASGEYARSAIVAGSDEGAFRAYARGEVDAVAGAIGVLRNFQRCGDVISRVDGPKLFRVLALSPTYADAWRVDDAIAFYLEYHNPVPLDPGFGCRGGARSVGLTDVYVMFVVFGCAIGCVSLVALAHRLAGRDACRNVRGHSTGGPENPGQELGLTVHTHPGHPLASIP